MSRSLVYGLIGCCWCAKLWPYEWCYRLSGVLWLFRVIPLWGLESTFGHLSFKFHHMLMVWQPVRSLWRQPPDISFGLQMFGLGLTRMGMPKAVACCIGFWRLEASKWYMHRKVIHFVHFTRGVWASGLLCPWSSWSVGIFHWSDPGVQGKKSCGSTSYSSLEKGQKCL